MCLIVGHFKDKKTARAVQPKIAKRNIWVWKKLNIYFDDRGNRHYRSPYRSKKYEFDKVYKSTFGRAGGDSLLINRGLHAYTDYKYGTGMVVTLYSALFPALIPKGSRYYRGLRHDIVSDTLIVYKDKKPPKSAFKKLRRIY